MLLSLREAQSDHSLQLILGADKRNPQISVYQSIETGTLHVYYGFELMEVVPDRREHVNYKLLVARLYNADVKARTLREVFEVDRKTMKKWGGALREGDPEKLVAVLAGRSLGKKIRPEIEGFVRARFESLYREHPRDYSAAMRKEIERYFGVSLSGEALRPLFGRLRGTRSSPAPETAEPGHSKKGRLLAPGRRTTPRRKARRRQTKTTSRRTSRPPTRPPTRRPSRPTCLPAGPMRNRPPLRAIPRNRSPGSLPFLPACPKAVANSVTTPACSSSARPSWR